MINWIASVEGQWLAWGADLLHEEVYKKQTTWCQNMKALHQLNIWAAQISLFSLLKGIHCICLTLSYLLLGSFESCADHTVQREEKSQFSYTHYCLQDFIIVRIWSDWGHRITAYRTVRISEMKFFTVLPIIHQITSAELEVNTVV